MQFRAANPSSAAGSVTRLLPGVALCAVAAAAAVVVNRQWPVASALLVAIVLGVLVTNLAPVPEACSPGVQFSAKRLLRIGIVLLGLQLVLGDIWALGWPMILGVVAIVGLGIAGCLALARVVGVPWRQAVLIACGFSICGAAAVAGVEDVVDADEDEVATAIALVVLFGTLMIPTAPLLAHAMGLGTVAGGEWVGGCVHEVAQVVAAGTALGTAPLRIAVVVKLARVLMLAPVAVLLGVAMRRLDRSAAHDDTAHTNAPHSNTKRPPLVPLFVVGFLAMVVVASLHVLPHSALAVAKIIQTGLLAAAMFALGMGVKVRKLISVGLRPVVLGVLTTAWVALVALGAVYLAGGLHH